LVIRNLCICGVDNAITLKIKVKGSFSVLSVENLEILKKLRKRERELDK
jgi:hypothetical protein